MAHDDLTAMLHARYRYEPGLRDLYRKQEESLAFNVLAFGRDVVIDRTHLTLESRERWIKWAAGYDSVQTFDGRGPTTPVIAVVFPVCPPEVHARRRFEADPRGRPYEEWLMVAEHHHAQAAAEPVGDDEGFAGVRRVGGKPGA